MPILEIAGPPDSLEASLEALDSYRETLQAPAVSGLRAVAGTPAPDRATLASLGYPQVQMVGSGTLEATIFFAQADLGGPIRGVALRLAGRTTPVPPGGHAQLWVLLNGGLVHAEPVLGGSFDKWISLPDGLLRRDNNLVIRLVYTPPGGECAPGAHPIGIIVDGASYLEFQRGTRLPAGFERLPQGLLPVFTVGLDPVSHETIGGAAQVVAAAQQVSRVRLVPKVRSWEDALAAPGPLLLVTLDPGKVGALRPPLEPRPFRVVDVEGREVLRMEMGQPFVVMEAFSSGGREVLMVTRHGDRPDLRELKRALDPRLGWYALSGDVWIWPHGGTPVAMRLRESGLRVVPLGPPPLLRWEKIRFGVMGVAVAAVVIFLVWVYPRLVRSGPPPAQPR